MKNAIKFASLVLALAMTCSPQEIMSIHSKGKQKWPAAEAQQIYLSACAVVQREFGGERPLAPRVTVVLGAEKNEVWFSTREIRLKKWNRDAFAQAVVWLAFEDLLPKQQRLEIATRALNWADSTVTVQQLTK